MSIMSNISAAKVLRPPGGARGPSPTHGLPSACFQGEEEESQQNPAVKISGDSDHLGQKEDCLKSRYPLAGPAYRLTHSQVLSLALEEGQQLGRHRRYSRKTELHGFRARAGGTATISPRLSPPVQPAVGTILPALSPPPRQQNLNLHWPGATH